MLIILTLFLGMAEGLQLAFSYLHAAKQKKKLRDLLKISSHVFLVIGILSYTFVLVFSFYFYRVFTPDNISIAIFAAEKSIIYFSGFIFAGMNILMISYNQAITAVKRSLIQSSLRGFIFPGLFVFLLPLLLGHVALWGCHSLAEITTFIVCILLFNRRKTNV